MFASEQLDGLQWHSDVTDDLKQPSQREFAFIIWHCTL
jgi:hypothetical protein